MHNWEIVRWNEAAIVTDKEYHVSSECNVVINFFVQLYLYVLDIGNDDENGEKNFIVIVY